MAKKWQNGKKMAQFLGKNYQKKSVGNVGICGNLWELWELWEFVGRVGIR